MIVDFIKHNMLAIISLLLSLIAIIIAISKAKNHTVEEKSKNRYSSIIICRLSAWPP